MTEEDTDKAIKELIEEGYYSYVEKHRAMQLKKALENYENKMRCPYD